MGNIVEHYNSYNHEAFMLLMLLIIFMNPINICEHNTNHKEQNSLEMPTVTVEEEVGSDSSLVIGSMNTSLTKMPFT